MSFANYPSVEGRVVAITGGATGIGASIVRRFSENRAQVAFLDIQAEPAKELARSIAAAGLPEPLFVACDLLDVRAIGRAFDLIRGSLGPVYGLVNNAANDQRQRFEDVGPEEFDWAIGVNIRHVYFAIQTVIPHMREVGAGSIVNMSSLAWLKGTADLQAYSVAKSGIIGLTSSLAHKLGGLNIRVNAITPGAVLTERQLRLWYGKDGDDRAILQNQCIPERVEPDDVARMALFLVADDSRHITKQCIAVDCGR
jgi:NAD(P)-dependent dehydrogenase (short-subunit alcohol dehydrogenase family)